jgi:hypothetical protein
MKRTDRKSRSMEKEGHISFPVILIILVKFAVKMNASKG